MMWLEAVVFMSGGDEMEMKRSAQDDQPGGESRQSGGRFSKLGRISDLRHLRLL